MKIDPASGTRGKIMILSAPSGAGKTTLSRALIEGIPTLAYSVSFTTRAPRPGEIDGEDYHFISTAEFEAGIRRGRWAEWACVHGNHYGTSADFLAEQTAAGRHVLLDIDVAGMRQVVARFPSALTIFIMPPSLETLRERLVRRGSEDEAAIRKRLKNAEAEIACRHEYRYVLVNDDLDAAKRRLFAIVRESLSPDAPSR